MTTIKADSPIGLDQITPSPEISAAKIQAKYQEEREKRIPFRAAGNDQYVDTIKTDNHRFKHFSEDPWIDSSVPPPRPRTDRTRVVILGAGYGAILFAVRLVQSGLKPEDILFIDSAGGFGGTWYWNRYPGLMCDVESYIYMPLLEETGYMPKHKYSYGPELRAHANRIVDKFDLSDKAIFSATIKECNWDDEKNEWKTRITLDRFGGESFYVTSDFVILASGVLNTPKVPLIPGIDDFKGHIFHTARFDYSYTGGTPEDQCLTNLKDKTVAVIGTGATAIQLVPELAKWAKEVYVFQRTPSAVDIRGQHPTDPDLWQKDIASKPGWQKERIANFTCFINDIPDKPPVNMVNDGWTRFPSCSGLVGGPHTVGLNPDNLPQYIGMMHALDMPRQARVRARVDEIVKDKSLAEALKPWYPGWCKRPCFHDDYLECFNRPNVHLVDTNGQGVERFTEHDIVYNSKEYPTDVLILSTGFVSPGVGNPASKAGVKVTGRNGLTMDKKWDEGVRTLHGVSSRGFPNLFITGANQAASSVNFVNALDVVATHTAYIVSQAQKMVGENKRFVVQPTELGEWEWTQQIMAQALSFAILLGCTPGYINGEGEVDKEKPMEEKIRGSQKSSWRRGLLDFMTVLEEWESEGSMRGLEVTPIS